MKQYQTQGFVKNGIAVNAVYIVKPGDTLLGIRKTVKRLGGNPKELEKIEPAIARGLAPGQFVYFHSDLERSETQQDKILNNHELERCPYQMVTLYKSNFKEKLDEHVGYKNAWIEVLALNRFQVSDFANSPSVQVKVYHAKKTFNDIALASGSFKNQTKKSNLDLQLAQNNEVSTEKVLVVPDRAPASEEKHEGPGSLVYFGFPILVIALIVAYRSSKKKIALDITD